MAAGQRVFGENRVQEAKAKWPALRRDYRLELHLIGPLQSNKAPTPWPCSTPSTRSTGPVAAALAKEIVREGRRPRLLVEVNTGAEPQKAGVLPEETDAFLARCRADHGLASTD